MAFAQAREGKLLLDLDIAKAGVWYESDTAVRMYSRLSDRGRTRHVVGVPVAIGPFLLPSSIFATSSESFMIHPTPHNLLFKQAGGGAQGEKLPQAQQ